MGEETNLINELLLHYSYDLPDVSDKKNEKILDSAFFTLTNQKIILIPEKNNKTVEEEKKIILLSDIIDVDRNKELWRKMEETKAIIPIHHNKDGTESITIISTTNDNAIKIKNFLSVLLTNGKQVDYVFPYSEGEKIYHDKKPISGKINLNKNNLILTAELPSKKQQETIDLTNIDDYEIGKENNTLVSVIIKYQKDGVLISTLITADTLLISMIDLYIKLKASVYKNSGETIELNKQQLMLLQMMYTRDIDAGMATETLGIDLDALHTIVNQLVTLDILRVSGDDEYELTEKGTMYIVEQKKNNIGE